MIGKTFKTKNGLVVLVLEQVDFDIYRVEILSTSVPGGMNNGEMNNWDAPGFWKVGECGYFCKRDLDEMVETTETKQTQYFDCPPFKFKIGETVRLIKSDLTTSEYGNVKYRIVKTETILGKNRYYLQDSFSGKVFNTYEESWELCEPPRRGHPLTDKFK